MEEREYSLFSKIIVASLMIGLVGIFIWAFIDLIK